MSSYNAMGCIVGVVGQLAITGLGVSLQNKLTTLGFLSPFEGFMLGCALSSLGWAVSVTLQKLTQD